MWDNKFKFRVFDLENKIYLPTRDNQAFYYNKTWLGIDWFIRQSESRDGIFNLYQYTGFRDKNESLIFEGDFLLHMGSSEIYKNPKINKTLKVLHKKISLITRTIYGFSLESNIINHLSETEWMDNEFKIIGNIETSLDLLYQGSFATASCKKNARKYHNKNYISVITGLRDGDLDLYIESILREDAGAFESQARAMLTQTA